MDTLSIRTLSGRSTEIDASSLQSFRAGLQGELLTPDQPAYEEARQIWNAMIERRPAAILRCAAVDDITRAVDFARTHCLLTSVRGGGHNIAGSALCEQGLMIDLSQMKSVQIDPEQRTAQVEPGATLADFDREAQKHGLATPLGINSTTGVAGLTLGGGFGWLTRKYGVTVDNLIGAELITANGQRVRASERENADLFWGIRGGGGNFGIVTRFEFRLHPVGPEVTAGLVVFPFDQASAVLHQYPALAQSQSDETVLWVVLRHAPPLPFLPTEAHGQKILVIAFFSIAPTEETERQLNAVRALGQPLGEHVGPMPYSAWQQAFDPLLTPGVRNYWKSHFFAKLDSGLLDVLLDFSSRLPSPHCEIFLGQLGGQASRVPVDATAYSHRDAEFGMNVHGRWETAAEDTHCVAWCRDLFSATKPYATGGVYVNFLSQDEVDRTPSAYRPDTWNRLVALKGKWDPQNLFRMNQNIQPKVQETREEPAHV